MKSRIKTFYIKKIIKKQLPVSLGKHINKDSGNAKILPLDKVYCVLNFDDLSPIPDKSKYIGRGGDINDFVSIKQMELLKLYPFLGITHFMVPQFLPSDYYGYFDKQHFSILNPANSKWIEYYKTLCKNYNIELSSHGLYHRQFENLLFARHTEFAYLNYDESLSRIRKSLRCFHEAGIEPVGFRPPGWDMNSDLSLVDAIKASGLKYAALSSFDAGLNSIVQRVSYYHPVLIKGVVNFPDNVNIDESLDFMKATIKKIVDANGIISIKGHFASHTLTNAFSENNFLKITEIIKFIKREYPAEVEFATFRDVYEKLSTSRFPESSVNFSN